MEISLMVYSKLKSKCSVPILKLSVWHHGIKLDSQSESIKIRNFIISEIQFIMSFSVPVRWLFKFWQETAVHRKPYLWFWELFYIAYWPQHLHGHVTWDLTPAGFLFFFFLFLSLLPLLFPLSPGLPPASPLSPLPSFWWEEHSQFFSKEWYSWATSIREITDHLWG